jgi:hypothetical protein
MWWTKNTTGGNGSKPRCPKCVTHPVLVQSGLDEEKSLKCPVCKALFDRKGVKYDPNAPKKEVKGKSSFEDEVMQEQEDLWDHLWGN